MTSRRTSRFSLALTPLLLLAACGESTPPPVGTGGTEPLGTGGAASGGGGTPIGSGGVGPVSGGAPGAGSAAGGSSGSGGSGGSGPVGTGGSGAATAGGSGGGESPPESRTQCPWTPPTDPATFPDNWTAAEVTQFNANGGWTWYNDERVVVDVEAGKIVVGSSASSASSQTSSTNIDVVIHDLATGQNDKKSLGNLSYSDDHNNPGIVIKAPGEYFASYAHHNKECNTYWANYGGGAWGTTVTHPWAAQGCPWGSTYVTYNNVFKLTSEGKLYNFIRSVDSSPTFLVSEDNGENWTWSGRLTASQQIGYNAGYYKYWGNGVDRIDFFATESHPRDSNTSVYHGYVQGGKSYDSLGQEVDGDIMDSDAPDIAEFTRVFQAGAQLDGHPMNHLWNFDVTRYADGTVAVLWQARENECAKDCGDPKHHMAYSRFDGTEWKSTRLVKGGRTLYRNKSGWWEEDYLGGAALDPDDPHVIYVSTNIDPRDDTTDVQLNEIWKGVTCDDGATFTWTPITMNSANENLRPVVPKWDANNYVLAWFRGNYQTAQTYSAEVVGIIDQE